MTARFAPPPPAHDDPAARAAIDELLGSLYREHLAPLTRWMTAYTRDEELAADVVQEAFLRLARELHAGRTPDNPPAWLAQVARNLATSHGRRLATANRLGHRIERPAQPEDPADAAIDAERSLAVRRVLAGLRPCDRTALLMAAEGRPRAEIAAEIGRSELATRALLHRTRLRLRPLLAAC